MNDMKLRLYLARVLGGLSLVCLWCSGHAFAMNMKGFAFAFLCSSAVAVFVYDHEMREQQ